MSHEAIVLEAIVCSRLIFTGYLQKWLGYILDELKMNIRKSKIIIEFFMTPASLDHVTDVIADVAV